MSRPKGKARIWSSDPTYPAGANVWNNAPNNATKVDPGDSAVAGGVVPDRQFPAQYFNQYQNEQSALTAYLDTIDVLNWGAPIATGLVVAYSGASITWDSYVGRTWIVGLDNANRGDVWFSFNGLTWSNEILGLGVNPGFASIAADPTDGSMWIVSDINSALGKIYFLAAPMGAWVSFTLATKGFSAIVWDDYEAAFVLLGKGSTNHPEIWTNPGGSAVSATVGNAASYTGAMQVCALGPGVKLAVGTTGGGLSTERLWASTTLAGPWVDRGYVPGVVGGTGTFRAMAYGAADGVFMIVTGSASGDQIFTSSDGLSWALRFSSNFWVFFSLVARGGVWVAQIKDQNNVLGQAISTDGGVSWVQVPWMYNQSALAAGLTVLDGRIASLASNASVSLSLRTR
jgi:hypothetical protein